MGTSRKGSSPHASGRAIKAGRDKVTEPSLLRKPDRPRGGLCLSAFFAVLLLFAGCSSYRAEPLYDSAERSLSDGAYHEALEGYGRVIDEFPGSSFAAKSQYRIADIYDRHLNEPDKALQAYSEVRYMYPARGEARAAAAGIAGIYSRGGDHKKAVEEYQALLDGPATERLIYKRLIAAEYLMMNDFRQARIEYEELASSDGLPAGLVPEILYQIASTYYIGGQAEEAARRFDEIIRKYPEAGIVMEARLGKGNALAEAGRTGEALSILRSLEREYPNKEALRVRIELLERRLKEGPQGRR